MKVYERDDEIQNAGVAMMPENPIYPLYVLREHLAEFSARARDMVERRFTLRHVGEAYVSLFQRLLGERSGDLGRGIANGDESRAANRCMSVLRVTA